MEDVRGTILGYMRGWNTQYTSYVLVRLETRDKPDKYIGHRVIAIDQYGNRYIGKILKRHSWKHPVFIVKFKPNIPGSLIGRTCIVK